MYACLMRLTNTPVVCWAFYIINWTWSIQFKVKHLMIKSFLECPLSFPLWFIFKISSHHFCMLLEHNQCFSLLKVLNPFDQSNLGEQKQGQLFWNCFTLHCLYSWLFCFYVKSWCPILVPILLPAKARRKSSIQNLA